MAVVRRGPGVRVALQREQAQRVPQGPRALGARAATEVLALAAGAAGAAALAAAAAARQVAVVVVAALRIPFPLQQLSHIPRACAPAMGRLSFPGDGEGVAGPSLVTRATMPMPTDLSITRRSSRCDHAGCHRPCRRAVPRTSRTARTSRPSRSTGRSCGSVECEHLDEDAHDTGRRIELATLLALGAGELTEEIFVDAPQNVLGAIVLVARDEIAPKRGARRRTNPFPPPAIVSVLGSRLRRPDVAPA